MNGNIVHAVVDNQNRITSGEADIANGRQMQM